MKSTIMGAIVLTGCLALAGCGQEQKTTPAAPTPERAAATQSFTPIPAPSSAASAEGGASSSAASSDSAAASSESSSAPATSKAAAAPVADPANFLTTGGLGKGHYFTSGPLHCAIMPMNVGCQSSEPVANRPKCDDPKSKAPYVAEDHTEPSEDGCTLQGIYVTEKPATELQPGQRLTVGRVTCEAKAVGSVVCETPDATVTANSKVFDYKAK